MARVTVEDCLKHVKNRFELVRIASKRARELMRGKEPKVEVDNDKSTVIALREIAAGYTEFDNTPKNHDVNFEIASVFEKTVETPIAAKERTDDDSL